MLAHGLLYVGKGNLAYIQEQTDQNQPDSWKGYNISNAAKVDNDPESLMRQWRHDDEEVAYPTFELIKKNYRKLKKQETRLQQYLRAQGTGARPAGSAARPSRRSAEGGERLAEPEFHHVSRLHSAGNVSVRFAQEVRSGKTREGVPDISWTTEYAVLAAPFKNIYAEIGTTWASSVVTFPTVAAHILGQLMKFMGPDRILFGSDSVWYGSPQWQIDAFWRFQIPEEMRKKYGYPELTQDAKRKILGLNSAKLYGIQGVERGEPWPAIQARTKRLREPHVERVEDHPGVSWIHGGRHDKAEGRVRSRRSRTQPHSLRVGAHQSLAG